MRPPATNSAYMRPSGDSRDGPPGAHRALALCSPVTASWRTNDFNSRRREADYRRRAPHPQSPSTIAQIDSAASRANWVAAKVGRIWSTLGLICVLLCLVHRRRSPGIWAPQLVPREAFCASSRCISSMGQAGGPAAQRLFVGVVPEAERWTSRLSSLAQIAVEHARLAAVRICPVSEASLRGKGP